MLQKELIHAVPSSQIFFDTEDKGDFYPGQFCAEAAEISFNFTGAATAGAAEAIIDITNKAYQTTLL